MTPSFDGLGFYPADILLPREGTDLTRWSVVACDQYTSQPEYWEQVDEFVGDSPSTLRLILPESKLHTEHVSEDIKSINQTMDVYQSNGLFQEYPESLIYVERKLHNGAVRRGLVGMVDLEEYDYRPGSTSLIRATEGTVLSRIPPRVEVRKNASLELPHIMLLIDDRRKNVIEPLISEKGSMQYLYDFDLMKESGHLSGWKLNLSQMNAVAAALRTLVNPEDFEDKYQVSDKAVLLFAVGDGNHSLATAKSTYELLKRQKPQAAKAARYALVELVNLHDPALVFEPIHRVLFHVDPDDAIHSLLSFYPGAYEGEGKGHVLHYIYGTEEGTLTIPFPSSQLSVGTLQSWLDQYLEDHGGSVDYIHGESVARDLAKKPDSLGFLLPPMKKEQLFRTVICDGVLPRKTFSMGEACDKRFYMEARKIR